MKGLSRQSLIEIISKLGGEGEKNAALGASAQSLLKDKQKPLVQAVARLVAKGKKGELRVFEASDALEDDSSDDQSEEENGDDKLEVKKEATEAKNAAVPFIRQKKAAGMRTGGVGGASNSSSLDEQLPQKVRLIFVAETKLGGTTKMKGGLSIVALRELDSRPTFEVIKTCVLTYVRGLQDENFRRFVTLSRLKINSAADILPDDNFFMKICGKKGNFVDLDVNTEKLEHYFNEFDESENSYFSVSNEEEPVSCLCATILVGVKVCNGKGLQEDELQLRVHVQHHSRLKNESSHELERTQPGDLLQFEIKISKETARTGEALFDRVLTESHKKLKEKCASASVDDELRRYAKGKCGGDIIVMSETKSHSWVGVPNSEILRTTSSKLAEALKTTGPSSVKLFVGFLASEDAGNDDDVLDAGRSYAFSGSQDEYQEYISEFVLPAKLSPTAIRFEKQTENLKKEAVMHQFHTALGESGAWPDNFSRSTKALLLPLWRSKAKYLTTQRMKVYADYTVAFKKLVSGSNDARDLFAEAVQPCEDGHEDQLDRLEKALPGNKERSWTDVIGRVEGERHYASMHAVVNSKV